MGQIVYLYSIHFYDVLKIWRKERTKILLREVSKAFKGSSVRHCNSTIKEHSCLCLAPHKHGFRVLYLTPTRQLVFYGKKVNLMRQVEMCTIWTMWFAFVQPKFVRFGCAFLLRIFCIWFRLRHNHGFHSVKQESDIKNFMLFSVSFLSFSHCCLF